MKIVMWIGNESNQKALANKVNQEFPIAGIVTETRASKSRITFKKLIEKFIEKLFLSSINKAWISMKKKYEKQFPNYPSCPLIDVENINCEETLKFTNEVQPDIILVSGTRMIKEKLLALNPKIGILNLHTGLSPFVKGGPNCTNWCIANREFNLIGNTIMWIDAGIDTGNIFCTEKTEIQQSNNLIDIHTKVMDHAHQLYVRTLCAIKNGDSNNVKQSELGEGKTYFTKDWGLKQKIALVKNMRNFKTIVKDQVAIKTIKIP